jgi:hypothetical protein
MLLFELEPTLVAQEWGAGIMYLNDSLVFHLIATLDPKPYWFTCLEGGCGGGCWERWKLATLDPKPYLFTCLEGGGGGGGCWERSMIRVVIHMVARKNPLHKSLGRVGILPPTHPPFNLDFYLTLT